MYFDMLYAITVLTSYNPSQFFEMDGCSPSLANKLLTSSTISQSISEIVWISQVGLAQVQRKVVSTSLASDYAIIYAHITHCQSY